MAPKHSKAPGRTQGTREWILETLRALAPGGRLSTTRIAKRIAKASGRRFHENSVYNALRTLVRKGTIGMVRAGREKLYFLRNSASKAVARSPAAARVSPAPATPTVSVTTAPLPHKLGLGEILVLRIDGGVVLSATNLHGRLVFERHKLAE